MSVSSTKASLVLSHHQRKELEIERRNARRRGKSIRIKGFDRRTPIPLPVEFRKLVCFERIEVLHSVLSRHGVTARDRAMLDKAIQLLKDLRDDRGFAKPASAR